MEKLAKKLAKLQVEIYWLHDAEDFLELKKSATKLYQLLGYSIEVAESVGEIISECYKIADQAEETGKHNPSEEKNLYELIGEKLEQVQKRLKYRRNIAQYQERWWYYARHKKNHLILYNLVKQNFISFYPTHLITTCLLTYRTVDIGLNHNRRDKERAIQGAEKFWSIVLNSLSTQNYSYLG